MACLEYEALNLCYTSLLTCVQQSPSDIADKLRPSGKLAPGVLCFLSNRTHDDDEKARKLLDAILCQVKNEPQVYHIFVSAMMDAGPWTKAALDVLQSHYASLQLATRLSLEHQPYVTSSLKSSGSIAQAQVIMPARSSSIGSQLAGFKHSGECLS